MMHETFSDTGMKMRGNETSAADLSESVLDFYVEGDDDLIGLLAYGLYERQKRDWVVSHRRRNSGRTPSQEEIAAVTSNYLSQDLRHTLRERAAHILTSYAETYVEAIEPDIRIATLNTEALRQARDLEESARRGSSFWRHVRVAFFAVLFLAIVFAAVGVGAMLFGADIVDAVKSLSGRSIQT
ncbi:hypothetical protein [Rhizobium sp. RU36D]|uniref:hypothetical protein n=1 Tax=Rhizobium sp. RU36D TaxID=1907415 RepID=UPI0009D8107B|nr:hypothetical protein [Rhizobium sp. RU36D]SMC89677.1 hypothetical protein SAMN05880593_109170 [Rhizobium sp. RU36D]